MYSIEASKRYTQTFESLLTFNDNSELYELAEENALSSPLSEECYKLPLQIAKYMKIDILPLDATLKKRLKLWNDCLDSELYECMQGNKIIEPLREIADQISTGKKTDLVRKKLMIKSIDNPDLMEALDRMDLMVFRIMNARSNYQNQKNEVLSAHLIQPELYSNYNFMNKAIQFLYPQFCKNKINSHSSDNFCEMIASLNNKELLDKFNCLTTINEVQSIAGYVTDQQSSFLIHYYFEGSESWELPIFLSNLSFTTFNALLLQLEDDMLTKINSLLKTSHDVFSEWINSRSLHILQTFMEGCNAIKVEIDYLAGQFRCEIRWNDITHQHLLAIQNLDDVCQLNLLAVKQLNRLLDGIAINPNFIIGIEELIQEYEHFIERLNNTPTRPEICGGIINIIVLNVFGDDIESNQKEAEVIQEILDLDTYHAFGLWNLNYPDDYREVGILGDLTDDEYMALLQDPDIPHKISPMNANRLLDLNLKKLGIETVRDLVQNRIFNQFLLKEYLNRKDIQATLNNLETPLSELLVNCNFQEKQIEQIQKLGWVTVGDLRKQKLFTPAMLEKYLSLPH